MSHKNTNRIINVQLDESHYEFLFTLSKAYKKEPGDVLRMIAESALDKAAQILKDDKEKDEG